MNKYFQLSPCTALGETQIYLVAQGKSEK